MDEISKAFDVQKKENEQLRDEISALKDVVKEGRVSRSNVKKKIPSALSVEL